MKLNLKQILSSICDHFHGCCRSLQSKINECMQRLDTDETSIRGLQSGITSLTSQLDNGLDNKLDRLPGVMYEGLFPMITNTGTLTSSNVRVTDFTATQQNADQALKLLSGCIVFTNTDTDERVTAYRDESLDMTIDGILCKCYKDNYAVRYYITCTPLGMIRSNVQSVGCEVDTGGEEGAENFTQVASGIESFELSPKEITEAISELYSLSNGGGLN